MRQEEGSRRMRQHALGRSTENEFSKAGPPIGTHDDHVDFADLHLVLQDLANRSAPGVDLVDDDTDTMQPEMPRKLHSRSCGVDRLFAKYGQEANVLRLLQKRHCIRD